MSYPARAEGLGKYDKKNKKIFFRLAYRIPAICQMCVCVWGGSCLQCKYSVKTISDFPTCIYASYLPLGLLSKCQLRNGQTWDLIVFSHSCNYGFSSFLGNNKNKDKWTITVIHACGKIRDHFEIVFEW